MKFIDPETGEIREGAAISDEQAGIRNQLVELFHQKVCRNSYHSDWDRRHSEIPCERMASFLVVKFNLVPRPDIDLTAEINAATTDNYKAAEPEQAPVPEPVAKDDSEVMF